MEDFFERIFLPVVFLFLSLIIAITLIKRADNETMEKINALVNKNDLQVYENCWKLEGKYYCKN